MSGVARIRDRFHRVRARKETALIPYFVAGYPSFRECREALWQAFEAGANLVELGIPFSDPVADGPTIARATHKALERGVTPRRCLQFLASLRREGFDLPVLGMTYANLLYAPGYQRSARDWARAGFDGAIVPDISAEDSADFRRAFRRAGLATVFFASPSTNPTRLPAIARASTGFLYLVSVYGTTGARTRVAPETLELLRRVRRARGRHGPPACVGFGVSRPEHVRHLRAAGADGVIVGSALVEAIDTGRSVRRYLTELKSATNPGLRQVPA